MLRRKTFDIEGIVQGVGFRPGVARLAGKAGLGGSVQNRSGSVRLVLDGEEQLIDTFIEELPSKSPPHSKVDRIALVSSDAIARPEDTFIIKESDSGDNFRISFPSDLAPCPQCLRELAEPGDRRYGYAFTTCTDCGPRYTVINDLPYDRERTTLNRFPLCAKCRSEYNDPLGRRFHAESIACPECGPQLSFADHHGRRLEGDPLRLAREKLKQGSIVAVRGIGGYLLAADAKNREAIAELRIRKNRPHKPFAVMVRSIEPARSYCHLPPAAEQLLLSPAAPIVILDTKPHTSVEIPLDLLTPDSKTLGVMLPNSPLQWLLFNPPPGEPGPPFDLLLMTSGNKRSEPICISNEEAFERLGEIADYVLLHNRDVNLRADDSVCILQSGSPQLFRRARGYAPNPLSLRSPLRGCVLALGPGQKNTIALGDGGEIIASPHIGDLETPEAAKAFDQALQDFPRFFKKKPQLIAVDLHPDYYSTRAGVQLAKDQNLPLVRIQHHFAHAAACLAEHGRTEGLALVFDGTGLGTDGTIWGAELIAIEGSDCKRLASFLPAPLPGGEAAIREPARQLFARFKQAGITPTPAMLQALGVPAEYGQVWSQQIERGLNAPLSHAAGRLFDSVSAALGFSPPHITYDGQAAMRLEGAATDARDCGTVIPHPFSLKEQDDMLLVSWQELFALLADPSVFSSRNGGWALAFHRSVAEAASEMVRYGLSKRYLPVVALSGGVFMNRILNRFLIETLSALPGITVLSHRLFPPNDGCIAIGQAFLAGSA